MHHVPYRHTWPERGAQLGISGVLFCLSMGCGNTVDVATGGSGSTQSVGDVNPLTSTGAGQCPGFEDAKPSTSVAVRFHNQTSVPIYLPGNCTTIQYQIQSTDPTDKTQYANNPTCLETCKVLQTENPINCSPCQSIAVRLDPGATREVSFDGTGLVDTTMPIACWKSHPTSTQCEQRVAAPAGQYRVNVNGFASCGADCKCDAQGTCTGMATGQMAYADPVTFQLPGDTAVDVVFGPCAFPCPNP